LRVEGTSESELKYYFAGSIRIAMREDEAITWLLADHLGSTSVTASPTGNLLSSLYYTAFGEIRTGSSFTDYQYTLQKHPGQAGQRNEAEIGLYYYVARYYDPALARFISADTIVPEPGSIKAYDRYAYVNGNPVNFNDPSGHCPLCVSATIGAGIGAVIGGVAYGIYAAKTDNFNWWHLAAAVGGGAVAGALIGTGVGWAAGVSQAAATSAAITGAGTLGAVNTACGGDICASEIRDGTRVTQRILPAVEPILNKAATSINTGTYVVYQYVENNVVKYVGRTSKFYIRANQHLNARGWRIEKIPGLDTLSLFDSKAVEQVLIMKYQLPNLVNKINGIATSNPIYKEAIQRGTQILQSIK